MNTKYFGVSYVRFLPPQDLCIPVLPGKYDVKLVYASCRTWAKKGKDGQCTYADRQREIFDVHTTLELELIVEKGYSSNLFIGLFIEYVQTFLKWKTEAFGFPALIFDIDDPEFHIFIATFFEKEGVKFDKEKIKNNPGLRYIA